MFTTYSGSLVSRFGVKILLRDRYVLCLSTENEAVDYAQYQKLQSLLQLAKSCHPDMQQD